MRKATVRDLHLRTSEIVREVAEGEIVVIEERGVAVAELRPPEALLLTRRLPNRESLLGRLPRAMDSGRILERER
jgi:antitoxin (DNA-binding transcriptional repressor) of toxin-antitoxin stability system